METYQNRNDFPQLKKLPFAESVQQLHRYNVHVAQVCFNSSQSMIQTYNATKEKYEKETQMRYDERSKAIDQMDQSRRKSLEAKQKEIKRRNQENLSKIQHYLAEKRNKMTRKEKQLMEESSARRQQYLQTLTSSFHHSQDRRSRIKMRQQNELQRSLLLLEQNQEKVRIANERKVELLEEVKAAMKQKNDEVLSTAIQNCKQKDHSRKQEELQRLIQKYDAAGKHISGLDNLLQKRTIDKKKEEEKVLEKHRKKRSDVQEEKQRKIEQDAKKDEAKIDKANSSKEQYLQTSVMSMQTKRKQKEKQLFYNTFYIQEQTEKRMNAIIHKHHTSQINLLNAKAEKQRMHNSNLQDSFRTTLRS